MLELKRITDKQDVDALAAEYAVETVKDLQAYVAENRGEILGVCFYRLTGEGMEILFAEANGDSHLYDGLLRAAMALLFDQENDRVVFGPKMDFEFLRSCGFMKDGEGSIKSANEFFETCKNCKK